MLARFRDFAASATSENDIRTKLAEVWKPVMDDDGRRKAAALWKDYVAAINDRELQLAQVALAPAAAPYSFPPLLPAADMQARLTPGQALLVYHDTPEGLVGFLFTSKSSIDLELRAQRRGWASWSPTFSANLAITTPIAR